MLNLIVVFFIEAAFISAIVHYKWLACGSVRWYVCGIDVEGVRFGEQVFNENNL